MLGVQIEYKNKSLEKICTIAHEAEVKHGQRMAELIHQRIDEIGGFTSVEMIIQFKIGKCHALTGDRKGQYAMNLVYPQRLVFEKCGNKGQIVRIMEITDYH